METNTNEMNVNTEAKKDGFFKRAWTWVKTNKKKVAGGAAALGALVVTGAAILSKRGQSEELPEDVISEVAEDIEETAVE